MSVETVETFYGLLALVAFAGRHRIVVVLRVAATLRPGGGRRWTRLVRAVAPERYAMAWVVALPGDRREPVLLRGRRTSSHAGCAGISGSRCIRWCHPRHRRRPPRPAGAGTSPPLAAIGAVVSAYHVALEWFPSLDSRRLLRDHPCTLVWFRVFGFISLPTLALSAFLLILTLMAVRLSSARPRRPVAEPSRRP